MISKINIINHEAKKDYRFLLVFSLVIFQIIGLSLVVLRTEDAPKYLYVLVLAFILVSILTSILIPKFTKGDNIFILLINMLYSIGLMMIIRINPATGQQHLIWYFVGIGVFLFSYLFFHRFIDFFRNKYILLFIITLLTFIVTIVMGRYDNGAKNWISIGPFSMQLSEFAKISYVFFLASIYYSMDKIYKMKYGKYYVMIATYIFIGLFFLQGELGTAMIFFGLFITSLFVYERRYLFMFINILMAFVGLYLAYKIFYHIRIRFEIWVDPWADPRGKGYQILQSLFAVASGGFFGSGIGLGSPRLIPVASSDFILAAIMEEMGTFMGIAILLIYVIFVYKCIKLSLVNRDIYYSIMSFCIGIIISLQALIMFGGVLKLIPLTGITTPFLSYGGSSMISNFILLAVLQVASNGNKRSYYEKQ